MVPIGVAPDVSRSVQILHHHPIAALLWSRPKPMVLSHRIGQVGDAIMEQLDGVARVVSVSSRIAGDEFVIVLSLIHI